MTKIVVFIVSWRFRKVMPDFLLVFSIDEGVIVGSVGNIVTKVYSCFFKTKFFGLPLFDPGRFKLVHPILF